STHPLTEFGSRRVKSSEAVEYHIDFITSMVSNMKRRLPFVVFAVLALCALAWGLIRTIQGPSLAAIEVKSQELVQTVVATGRITAVSRAQVGSQVTGVVRERRVKEGDVVQPGDIL